MKIRTTSSMLTKAIAPARNSLDRPPLRGGLPRKQQLPRTQTRWIIRGILPIPFAFVLAWFALSPLARAVDPPPDGGYPNQNTAEGDGALFSLTTGTDNTAIGFNALVNTTTGTDNTAIGFNALFNNDTGDNNTANGVNALYGNTDGNYNTANGVDALFNGNGDNNTAIGFQALFGGNNYSSGSDNTATGANSLYGNTDGSFNTATGSAALYSNTSGINNTATGANALYTNSNGNNNTATGEGALYGNKTGSGDTANGQDALYSNTDGSSNAATGFGALFSNTSGFSNTANGWSALLFNTTGSNNIGLGVSAGGNLTTGSNNIDIGNTGVAGESAKIRIGTNRTHKNTYIAGINGVTVARGVGVIIDTNGHLGTVTSSERFKDAIKPMDKASEAILALQPVTFRYKHELDPDGIPQFGLVAEQVEKVNPDLVVRDDQGKAYTVRYEAVNAMLLNEFLKEHRKNEEQQEQINVLTAQLKEHAAQIQKVSAQLEASKPVRQVVKNP